MRRRCTLPDCDKPHSARGYCSLHYTRWRVHGDPHVCLRSRPNRSPQPVPGEVAEALAAALAEVAANRPPPKPKRRCTVPGCTKPHAGKGYCDRHLKLCRRNGGPFTRRFPATCTLPGCDEPYEAKGYCSRHYTRWRRYGDPYAGAA